jgi:hypothetical protein
MHACWVTFEHWGLSVTGFMCMDSKSGTRVWSVLVSRSLACSHSLASHSLLSLSRSLAGGVECFDSSAVVLTRHPSLCTNRYVGFLDVRDLVGMLVQMHGHHGEAGESPRRRGVCTHVACTLGVCTLAGVCIQLDSFRCSHTT